MGSNSSGMNERIEKLKEDIKNLKLGNKGKNLTTKENLYETVGDVYDKLKKICPTGQNIKENGKLYMYIKERLKLLGGFCWKILGCSDNHILGGGWKNRPNSFTSKPSILSEKEVEELKESYYSGINDYEAKKYKPLIPSLTLGTMNSFVNNICESYEKNLGSIVNDSVEKDTTKSS